MKVILKAISSPKPTYEPQIGWWSFKDDTHFYLCRYGHIIGKFYKSELIESKNETRTDTAGLNFLHKPFKIYFSRKINLQKSMIQ